MICSDCHCQYEGLACPACMHRKSREAYLRQQLLYLDDALGGRLKIRIVRLAPGLPWHLALFNERAHAYCGESIERPQKQDWSLYADALKMQLCDACRAALEELAATQKGATS